MANPEHVEIVKQGAKAIAAWRERGLAENLDLSEADLSRVNLIGAKLGGAHLITADLESADLSGANLAVANLTMAGLGAANLIAVDLEGADLTGAPPWVTDRLNPPNPERVLQWSLTCTTHTGLGVACTHTTQGGAPRLRRFAYPGL